MHKRTIIILLHVFLIFGLSGCSQNSEATPESMTVTLDLQTPTSGWSLEIQHAWLDPDGQIICLSQLTPPAGMAAQVISQVHATAILETAEKPIRHYILGKTWNWNSDPDVSFIETIEQIQKELDNAQSIVIAK